MSDATRQAIEEAIAAHVLDENEDKSVMLSEWVIITAAQYMNPEKPYITAYSWACTENISHSHLMGLLKVGVEGIESTLNGDEP